MVRSGEEPWRALFEGATRGFEELVAAVRADQWELPGLGTWTVRELVGHTSRALSTISTYLDATPRAGSPVLDDAVAYFRTVFAGTETDPGAKRRLDEGIAERGRQAGADLGADPAAAVADLASRARELVRATAADTPVTLAVGTMSLAAYVPTRTFELAVHSVDLARATGLTLPEVLAPAVSASCELAGRIAAAGIHAAAALMLLTGRTTAAEDEAVSLL